MRSRHLWEEQTEGSIKSARSATGSSALAVVAEDIKVQAGHADLSGR